MLRSPIKGDGKEEDLAEILKEWREEMKREMREGIRGIREDIRKMAEEQKEEIKREVEEIRGELVVREENWRKEREELRERLERMENKLEREKGKKGKGREVYEEESLREGEKGKERDWRERVKELERRWERRERNDRRKNIMIKGLKEGEDEVFERVEGLMKELGGEIKVEEVREIKAGKTEKGMLLLVKLKSEEMKRKVLIGRGKLKGKEIWIEEDLTWEERRIRWRIRRIANEEEAKGKRVRIAQGGIWLEGIWWGWDEELGRLRNAKGKMWGKG